VQENKAPESEQIFQLAQGLIPGGVNTPIRSFDLVGGIPRFIVSGDRCYLTDVDGRRYIDYVGSWGAAILGHNNSTFTDRVCAAVTNGASFGLASQSEVDVARRITNSVPAIEKVRMVNTGSEGVLTALRLARFVTRRHLVVKFQGCYHGQVDDLLVASRSPFDLTGQFSDSMRTLVLPYNDLTSVRRCFDDYGHTIAAVIIEPITANMGVVLPHDGFLPLIRSLTQQVGALLIFDEVVTGFRVGSGGAQEALGVRPDLTVFGKALGGGLPVGAYGGPSRLMDLMTPLGSVFQGGTFSGNPVTCAAVLATLSLLDPAAYQVLEIMGEQLQAGLTDLLSRWRVKGVVQRYGSMLSLFFGLDHVTDYGDASRSDVGLYAKFFHGMLDRGVHLPTSPLEAWFVSLAHTEQVIEETLRHANEVFRRIQ